MNTSNHDAELEYLRGVLPWTTSTQFKSLNRAFERLESQDKIPVWLTVHRGDSGYDFQTKRAEWAANEKLWPIHSTVAIQDDEQRPIVTAYHRQSRQLSSAERSLTLKTGGRTGNLPPIHFSTKSAFEYAADAGQLCKPLELPGLDVGSGDELGGAVRWLAVLHRMHGVGLLHGGEKELLMSLNPPTNAADSLAYLFGFGSDGESHNERYRTVRRRGFVWKLNDFVRMSVNATAILAKLAEETATAPKQRELSLVGLLDEVLIAIDEGQSFEHMYPLLRQVEPLRLEEFGDDRRWPGCLVRFEDGCYQLYTKHPHLDEHHQAEWVKLSDDDDKELRPHVKRVIRAWLRQLEPDEKRLTRLGGEPANQPPDAKLPQGSESTEITGGDADRNTVIQSLNLSHRLAILAYDEAAEALDGMLDRVTDKVAWEWIGEHSDYDPPTCTTFTRYLREARRALGENKHRRRAGRSGRSIVGESGM